ncbi:hypothetical protein PFICI_02579 [Pestalotiopsis fici W106-1]|uniref:Rhodopsin domain-containing protein n=1 Tax=Pestalotiopsis fici (strain W106-1 / CGMCC3.15140) TaxID=1229662 RepID=W3XEW1_PESFW|nr:uncharacterized protein PFICI_02579 [Pestalotiopsis fici W106-1]ETS84554.1 hypothetical protein PFICI_02579 [Pestalotiopsis fici W106-1]
MADNALVECRAEYAIGTLIFILRWFAQWRVRGALSWSWIDWFSISAWFWFTSLYIELEVICVLGAPVGFTQEMREALTPQQRISYEAGAKIMFSCFFILIFLVWSLKGCLIFLFLSLTRDTRLYRYVQIVGIITALACLMATITQATHCLPYHRNWQILPDPGRECSTGYTTNIVIATGNVLTDVLLLAVPFLMLRDVNMKFWRKIQIGFLLSLGLFVIAMAITRCVLSIGDTAAVALASSWAQREALVAIFAVNAPLINPILSMDFWRVTKRSSRDAPADDSDRQSARKERLGKPKFNDFTLYKMTNLETTSRESTTDLVDRTAVSLESAPGTAKTQVSTC